MELINFIIKKKIFKNLIINIPYKNLNLKDVAYMIQQRIKFLFKFNVDVKIKEFDYYKYFLIYTHKIFRFNPVEKKINDEIDQTLKIIKKIKKNNI